MTKIEKKIVKKEARLGRGAEGKYYMDYVAKGLTFPRNIFNSPKIKIAANLALKLTKGAVVLDAGCGAGYVSEGMAPRVKLIGVDIEKEAVEFCQKNRKGKFLQADLESLPFKNNYFDLIIFTNTIEHLENPHPILSELTRVLKPGGKLYVTTENCNNFFWLLLEQTWFRFFGGPCKPYLCQVHPQRYTPKMLQDHLSQHLKVESMVKAILGMELLAVAKKKKSGHNKK